MRALLFPQWDGLWVVLAWNALLVGVFVGIVSVVGMMSIWAERKLAGHMQSRLGPNRVGPVGLLQSLADGLKLMLKEDLIPQGADRLLFRLAPYLSFIPPFVALIVLPFGPQFVYESRLSVGLFWILAILSVEIMGVILAGWASNNKWSIYGAMREACQMVSYEIPLGLSIIVAVAAAGTLNLVELGHLQSGGLHTWLIFRNPFVFMAFFVYFVASLASNKRAPFDLPESESELVAGFHTEYSGMRFAFFFFAEYTAVFVVSAIQVALFLGGWNDPFGLLGQWYRHAAAAPRGMEIFWINVVAAAIFSAKTTLIVFVQMWLRWTLPRPRIDQVLYACVKVLLPMSCVLLLGGVLWEYFVPSRLGAPWFNYQPWNVYQWWKLAPGSLLTQGLLSLIGLGVVLWLTAAMLHAAITGRGLQKRLTDPEPLG